MKKLLTTLFGFILFYHVVAYVTPTYAAGAQAKPKPIPNIITVNIVVKNQGSVVLNQFHYTPAIASTLPKKPYLVDNLYANQWASFPIQMLPGISYFNYGYDQNNYCRLQLQVSPNGSVLVMSTKNYGGAQCATPSVSGKTVTVTINMTKPVTAPTPAPAVAPAVAAARAAAQAAQATEGAYCAKIQMGSSGNITCTLALLPGGKLKVTNQIVFGSITEVSGRILGAAPASS